MPVATTIAGLAVSPYLIALFRTVERITPRARYTTGIAIVCAGGALGSAFGLLAGGALAQRTSSDAFLLAVGAATVALIIAAVFTGTGRCERHTEQRSVALSPVRSALGN